MVGFIIPTALPPELPGQPRFVEVIQDTDHIWTGTMTVLAANDRCVSFFEKSWKLVEACS